MSLLKGKDRATEASKLTVLFLQAGRKVDKRQNYYTHRELIILTHKQTPNRSKEEKNQYYLLLGRRSNGGGGKIPGGMTFQPLLRSGKP